MKELPKHIIINGEKVDLKTISNRSFQFQGLTDFLKEWSNDKPYIITHTSGSTGTPKEIQLAKTAIVQSALKTIRYFKLSGDDRLLLCLPVNFIAGKLMVIRALIAEANLITGDTNLNPLNETNEKFRFSAMTPAQVATIINQNPEKLKNIEQLLVGGAPLQMRLEQEASRLTKVHISYGMTETITHVAIRDAGDKVYHALDGVIFNVNPEGNLIIETDHINGVIQTTDQVKLIDNQSFEWLGRADNVINSGGKKFFPEQLERKLEGLFDNRYYINSFEDNTFGSSIGLVIESEPLSEEKILELKSRLSEVLEKHEVPKKIVTIPEFEETGSGKIKRQ